MINFKCRDIAPLTNIFYFLNLEQISLVCFTCSEYKTEYKKARECINKARKKDCKFNDDVLDITARINNPFCSQGTSKSLSTMLQLAVSIIPFMFFA